MQLISVIVSAALFAGLGIGAWRFGYDSRDGIERDEPARTTAWIEGAARRRERIGTMLTNLFVVEMEARYRQETLQRDLERARLVREAAQARRRPASLRETYELCAGVVLRTLVPGPRLMLSEMIYRRHASTPFHVHPTEQVGYVVRGRMRLLVGERESVIAAGETYVVPPEVSHCLEALDDATVLVSSVAS